MHTCLKFNLAQNMDVFQRLAGMDNELPYTGHTLSDGSTITVRLQLGHLMGWTFTRLISSGSIEMTNWLIFSPRRCWGYRCCNEWLPHPATFRAKTVRIVLSPCSVTYWALTGRTMSATLFPTLRAGTVRVVTTAPLHACTTNAMLMMFSANLHGSYAPGFSSIQLMPRSLKNQ